MSAYRASQHSQQRVHTPVSTAELIFATFAVLLSTGAFLTVISPDNGAEGVSSIVPMTWTVISILSVVLLQWVGPGLTRIASDWRVWALIAPPILSTLWSMDPLVTLKHSIALIGTGAFGLYMGVRMPRHQQLQIVTAALCFAAIASAVVVVVFPEVGVMQSRFMDGEWAGVFAHKSTLGQMMILNCLCLQIMHRKKGSSLVIALLLVLSLVLIWFSESKTALLAIPFLLLAPYVLRRKPKQVLRWIVLGCVLCVIPFLAGIQASDLLEDLGPNATLTGRVPLWYFATTAIAKRPVFGHGYAAFWSQDNQDAAGIRRAIGWNAPNCHNGALELLLGTGIFGLICFTVGLGAMLLRLWEIYRVRKSPLSAFLPLFLLMMIFFGLDESTFLGRNSIFTVMMFAIIGSTRFHVRPIRPMPLSRNTRPPMDIAPQSAQ
jgi:exopolysaccharide production protein ExoQ